MEYLSNHAPVTPRVGGVAPTLSDAKIRSLKPKEKAYKVYDDRGLYMVVNPNGTHTADLPHFSHLRRVIMSLDGGRQASAGVDAETLRFPMFPRNVGMLEDGLGRRGKPLQNARGRTLEDAQPIDV